MRKILILLMIQLACAGLYAQSRTLTGNVKDEKGEPIPFATIMVEGSKKAVVADAYGNFTIQIDIENKLVITASGHASQTIKPEGSTITIILTTAYTSLSEVVVTTALGIKRESKELGYAATSITNKALTQAQSVNVQQALNGKVSGLNITTVNSGVFETAKINIRGIRSLTGNNQPMLVVDGAPTPLGFLYSIPPDDIQDITVLKSAASAAIYGPDAVNGVIVVTTKRGSGNQLSVTVNSSIQLAQVAYFPKLQKSFGDGAGEVVDQYGNYGYVPYENQQYGPAFDGSTQQIGRVLEDGSVQTGPYSNAHYKDKVKFWNTGQTFQNSVSVAGQDFYLSAEDASIHGLMPDDQNRRSSFRFNGGKKYGKFSINYGINYVQQNYNVVDEAGFASLFPGAYNGSVFFLVLQTADNIPLLSYKDWQHNKFAQYSNYYNEFAVNPYWVIGNIRQRGREDDLLGDVEASFQVAPWLKASFRANSDLAFQNYKNTQAPVVVSDWARANRSATNFTNIPGKVFDDESYTSRLNMDYFLSGDQSFSDFSLKYIFGGAIRQNRSKDVAVGGNNLVVPYLYNVSVRSGDASVPLYPNNADVTSRLLSAYGSVDFGYKDWAFLEVTGRNDWDSRLLPQNRLFFYPGANVSFVLSDAIPALKNLNFLSYTKVRAAYSKSGNVNVPVYSLQATYAQPGGFPYGNVAGFTANQTIPNPDLKPEFIFTKEAGVELGFFKNRIDLQATYFYQNCDNQILQVSQSATTGYTIGLANAASFKNYGVEMDLGLNPIVKIRKGRIDFKINGTYNNNKVTATLNNIPVVIGGNSGFIQNAAANPTVNNIAIVGQPAFSFQMTDYQRDSLGRIIVDAKTGLPSPAGALITRGRTLPLWVIGFTPSYSVGNFSVSMTWDYKGGHDFFAGIGADEDFAGISARGAEYGRQRFVIPNSVYKNDEGKYVPNTNIQVQDGNAGFWSTSINTGIATNYFASANAWRLREINVSYNLPAKWLKSSHFFKRVTVSAIGKNLLLFVPKSNQWGDPEFNYSSTNNTYGISSSFQSPASRLFGGSLTIQF